MKKIFTFIVGLLITLSVSASHVHLSLTGVANNSHFYYCQSTVDSVIVHKPAGAVLCEFISDFGTFSQDSIIITPSLQGFWYCGTEMGQFGFYIHFVSIAPTQSWTMTDISKCTESSITLNAQTTTQPDFTYAWSTGLATQTISVNTPATYIVTVTGACGVATDEIQVLNYAVPTPNLGPDQTKCQGQTLVLNPGSFSSYSWSTGVATPSISVTTSASYRVTVTDANSCHGSDEVNVGFISNDGEMIKLVTIDTITGKNKVTWDTLDNRNVTTVIYRESSSNVYTQVGTASYKAGQWSDNVNSVNQTWRYKIATIDSCDNESAKSPYHQTISSATVPLVPSGYRIEWTEYKIEGVNSAVSNYYLYSIGGLGNHWAPQQLASLTGTVSSYNLPSTTDSLFVVGAQLLADKTLNQELAFSNVVAKPTSTGIAPTKGIQVLSVYPNPASNELHISGISGGVIRIMDITGRIVLEEENMNELNIGRLEDGVYQLTLTKDGVTYQTKLVKN